MPHTTRRKLVIIVVFAIVVGAVGYFWLAQRPSVSMDSVEVVHETQAYVDINHKAQTGRLYKSFETGFEDTDFLTWFGDGKWTTINLLSPQTKTVAAYADLRRDIFSGKKTFLDNRIDYTADNAHTGKGAARFQCVPPSSDMGTSKSLLEHNQLWFVKGDDLWFRGWYYLESGVPFTIADFQERGRKFSPGPRICIWNKQYIGAELKARSKPKLKQTDLSVPLQTWFELKVHLRLDDTNGHVNVWQNGTLIIDNAMPTLHSANTILNALEVGITASGEATTLLVDDVAISHHPL